MFKLFRQENIPENLAINPPTRVSNIVPENEIPELTTSFEDVMSRIPSSILTEGELIDVVLDRLVSTLIDDGVILSTVLNSTPEIFDTILNNNEMLRQLLVTVVPISETVTTPASILF